ncbi:MAG: NERD domain-containing protein [Thaumarchaeota archaeon]|nr:NERD domain-containing protein [Nitrososphaerota archaeon]
MPKTNNQILKELEAIIEEYDKKELLSILSVFQHFGEVEKSHGFNLLKEVPALIFVAGLSLKKKEQQKKKPTIDTAVHLIHLLNQYFSPKGKPREQFDILNPTPEYISNLVKNYNLVWQINIEKYHSQHLEYLKEVYGKLDAYYNSKVGFTIGEAIEYCFLIGKITRDTLNRKVTQVLNEHTNEFGQITTDDFLIYYNMNDGTIDSKKGSVLKKVIEEYVSELFVFDVNEAKTHSIDVDKFQKFLDVMSCEFGEQFLGFTEPIDDNLFHLKPVIHIRGSVYLCPLTEILASNLPLIFDTIISKEKQTKIWHKYQKIKSKFVEEKVSSYLSRIFPEKHILQNLVYQHDGKRYEIDTMVYYDNKLILFESKSGHITNEAKRGSIKELKSSLYKITEHAYKQGKRVREYVQNTDFPIFRDEKNRQILQIQKDHKIDFLVVNVTLEGLAVLATNLTKLRALDLFDEEYPWSVSVFHLDTITQLIPSPSIFIHYIEQRLFTQDREVFFTLDEMTLLGLYLDVGIIHQLKQSEMPRPIMFVTEWRKSIDDYFEKNENKPKIQRNPTILKLVDFLERTAPVGFTEVTSILLDMPSDMAELIEKNMDDAIKRAREKNYSTDFSIVVSNPELGISFITSHKLEGLEDRLFGYCTMKKHEQKIDRWIGIGKNINDNEWFVDYVIYLNDKWEEDPELDKIISEIKKSWT